MIELKEIVRLNSHTRNVEAKVNYLVKSIFVNPSHIVLIKEFSNQLIRTNLLREGKMTEEQNMSSVTISRGSTVSELTILGSPKEIKEKIFSGRGLLNG